MSSLLFLVFSAIMLGFALLVVLQRNPVASALSLVASFGGLAALFVTLDAYFIGILQILVYAGAVMVLFLFIIMLLDIRAEERRQLNKVAVAGGALLVCLFLLVLAIVLSELPEGRRTLREVPLQPEVALAARDLAGAPATSIRANLADGDVPDVKLIGEMLFTRYTFHLQVIGVLLLVATAGVVILSRRDRDAPAGSGPADPLPPS